MSLPALSPVARKKNIYVLPARQQLGETLARARAFFFTRVREPDVFAPISTPTRLYTVTTYAYREGRDGYTQEREGEREREGEGEGEVEKGETCVKTMWVDVDA